VRPVGDTGSRVTWSLDTQEEPSSESAVDWAAREGFAVGVMGQRSVRVASRIWMSMYSRTYADHVQWEFVRLDLRFGDEGQGLR
jgi:hypothetical protein